MQKVVHYISLLLMCRCFPQHITEALLRGEKVSPEHKEMVSIFFRSKQKALLMSLVLVASVMRMHSYDFCC